MSNFNLYISFDQAVLARVVQGLGLAFLFVPINTMAFYFIPRERINNATGLINLARNLGGSVGIANVATLLARRSQAHQQTLISHLTPLDQPLRSAVSGTGQFLLQQGSSATQSLDQAQGLVYGSVIRQASMQAYVDVFWLLGITFLALIPLMFLMKTAKPHPTPVAPAH
jgi:MFS transporter, DHA2 family, multidrug resistance protein